MKKLILAVFFVSSCLILFAPNLAQFNDLDNLQKQITTLKNSNIKLEVRLKQFIKTSTSIHDSLRARLKENDLKLKALSDSLSAKESQITALKADSEKTKTSLHSLIVNNTIQYIFLVLILVLMLVIYYLLSKKTEKVNEQNESHVLKTKEGLENELNKTSKELKTEISATKGELQGKIDDMTKKISALNKQG